MPEDQNKFKSLFNKTLGAELAYIDDLTGLYNRRYLNAMLPEEIDKAKKEDKKFSLFMIDYDGFKAINDTYGHLIGDRVLIEIAGVLTKEIGKSGTLIRYAGDEFTVMLPEEGLKEAIQIAKNLLQLAAECKIELKEGKSLSSVTLSIGVAVYPDDASLAKELLDKADQALYSSKRSGKNRVSTVSDLVVEVRDRNLLLSAVPCRKFINREKEIEFLKKAYDSAKKGAKEFVLIEGKAGAGKTRLMSELINFSEPSPGLLLKCQRENLDQQYGIISAVLNELLDFLDARKVLTALSSLSDISKHVLVSRINKIKDLPIRYSSDAKLLTKDLREEDIFSAFTGFVKALELPMIPLALDDILWIDKGSAKVIKWMLLEPDSVGILFLGSLSKDLMENQTAQEIPFATLLKDKQIQQISKTISLKPLTEKSTLELLESVFPDLSLPDAVKKKIFTMSWGYPSNIEEFIKCLLGEKVIYPKAGKWAFDAGRVNKIPTSLKNLFDKQISKLDDESRELLSKAAILGDDFNIDLLKSFYGKNEGQFLDILDKLQDEHMLQESTLPGGQSMGFANKLIKKSIYDAIKKKELQRLHGEVAALLQNYYRSGAGRVYGKLKYHLEEAGEAEKLQALADEYKLAAYAEKAEPEEAEPSIEEIIERPLSEDSAKIAPEVLFCLKAAWINSQLYPSDNKTRMNSIESLNNYVTDILKNDKTLTITAASEENIILNGQPIPPKRVNLMLSRSIASLFSDYGINSITFKRGLSKEEIDSFFLLSAEKEDYIKETGVFAKLLKEKGIANIRVNEIRYRKASDLTLNSEKTNELFKKIMPKSWAVRNLFSVDAAGLTVNKEVLSDPKKTIDYTSEAIRAMSKQDTSEENKTFMMLESLRKIVNGFTMKDIKGCDDEKARLGRTFMSLDPILRTKIIKEGAGDGEAIDNLISNALSGLDDAEAQKLLKQIGMCKEPSKKAKKEGPATFFFEKAAKEFIEGGKSEMLNKRSMDNLRPLTEALAIKGDVKTLEKLSKSLLTIVKSDSAKLRIMAIKAIGKVSKTLLEKEMFDISVTIETELSSRLKVEDDINAYLEILNVLEMMINMLLNKQNTSLLISPLAAIEEEASVGSRRPAEFKNRAQATVSKILKSDNMDLLLLSFKRKAEKDYLAIIDLIARFGEKALNPLMELLLKKDDVKLDPFDIYMKKQNIAFIIKRIGVEAIDRLKKLLNDKRAFVVKNTVEVFGNMGDKKCIPYIEQLTHYPDKEVQKEVRNALKRLKG